VAGIFLTSAIGSGQRFAHQVGNGASLAIGQIAKALVERFVQVQLGANHAMHIHRRTSVVNGMG